MAGLGKRGQPLHGYQQPYAPIDPNSAVMYAPMAIPAQMPAPVTPSQGVYGGYYFPQSPPKDFSGVPPVGPGDLLAPFSGHVLASGSPPTEIHEKRRRVDAASLTPLTPLTPTTTAKFTAGAGSCLPSVEVPPRHELQKPEEVVLAKVVDATPPSDPCDDDGGHYVVKEGERFAGRYVITRQLGQGTFGKVAEAYDEMTGRYCAIKIIRAIPKYRDASKIELRVLSMLTRYDPHGTRQCVCMRECFDYRNHVCLVTDLLDISVYDFLKENDYVPFPGHHIASFAKQILRSVAYIHSLGLVHTDLKPENILLHSSEWQMNQFRRGTRGPMRTRKELKDTHITLIDFGSAIFDDEYHSNVVSTRHYRAPEIVLGTGWSFPCDIWSVGCVLVELCTGLVLFQTRDNLEHLHMMEKTLRTRFSPRQLAAARLTAAGSQLVDSMWDQLVPLTDNKRMQNVAKQSPLAQLVQGAVPYTRERTFWNGFLDLVQRLLMLDPGDRLTASEALDHPWLRSYAP